MRPKLSLLLMLLTMLGVFALVNPPNAQAADAEKVEKKDDAKKDEPSEIGPRALTAKIIEQVVLLLKGFAWPAAVVLIAWWYRKEIRSLLRRLKKIKAGGVEAEIADKLAKAKAAADDGGLPPPPTVPPAAPPVVVSEEEGQAAIARAAEKAKQLGMISGPAAIVEMWTELEFAATEIYRRVHAREPRTVMSIVDFMKELVAQKKLSPESFSVFNELRKIRNHAIHLPEERNKIGKVQTEEYIVLCARLIRQLLDVAKTIPDPSAAKPSV